MVSGVDYEVDHYRSTFGMTGKVPGRLIFQAVLITARI